jgi:hypothetical protein
MSTPIKIAAIASAVLLVAFVWGISSLAKIELVTNHYATRSEAEADRLFDRGWLPPLIPLSATKIRVGNDLDTNTSTGSFAFDPRDASQFTEPLTKADRAMAAASHPDRAIGVDIYTFSDDHCQWTFFVSADRGHCDYVLQPRY